MQCPRCHAEMEGEVLDARLGTTVAIDVCRPCQEIWFDSYEDLRLAPSSTARMFQIIAKQAQAPVAPSAAVQEKPACPRCDLRLLVTHDQQHTTKFEYLRCGRGHGRLMTFVNFLLEKDFVRPLSQDQIDELRDRHIQVISCSTCGAPVDLTRGPACAHCGSTLSMLDIARMGLRE